MIALAPGSLPSSHEVEEGEGEEEEEAEAEAEVEEVTL
jgi:hypothetical protein